MKKVYLSGWVARALVVAGILAVSLPPRAVASDSSGRETSVVFRIAKLEDYRSFVKNWDDKKTPVLCALIDSPARWDKIFHPAPVMGKPQAFAPEEKEYEKSQLLVVARVTSPPPDANAADKLFRVEKISVIGGDLVFCYHFEEPKTSGSYQSKNCLAVWIPRGNYRTITFIENGKPGCVLELSKGNRAHPETM